MDRRSILFICALTASLVAINWWYGKDTTQPQITPQTIVVEEKISDAPRQSFTPISTSSSQEEFYLLENEYQQLVISTLGGSLAEINLKLKSDKSPDSIVNPIGFDNSIAKNYPQNDHFPQGAYYALDETGKAYKTQSNEQGGYYPLIRRSLATGNGKKTTTAPARFYALATLDEEDIQEIIPFKVTKFTKDSIELQASQGNRKITKSFKLPANPSAEPYTFEISQKLEGDTRGLVLTSGVPEVELVSGSWTPVIKYRYAKEKKSPVDNIKLPSTKTDFTYVNPEWVSNSNGFLGLILQPLDDGFSGFSVLKVPGNLDPSRITLIDSQYDLYPAEKYAGYEVLFKVRKNTKSTTLRVFAGPFSEKIFKTIDQNTLNPMTGKQTSFKGALSFHGWFTFISEPFAKFLYLIMKGFYAITHSWGISIILLTVVLRIMLYPLNAWSIKSNLKMQKVQPEVQAIQARYKKDPKRAQLETMQLYRERGVNPLTGCLPLLIQIPFLIGMFDLLKSSFELRGASFIPGWINDLSAPDSLFSWGYPLPFFGNHFHLLPLILGAAMWWQQYISAPKVKDAAQLTDQQRQQRAMGNIMTIVFTVMFYHFPSGLNLYWLSSMLLGIWQQWWMNKRFAYKNPHVILPRK